MDSFAERLISLLDGMDEAPVKADLFRTPITAMPAYFLRYEGRGEFNTTRFGIVLLHNLEIQQGNPYAGIEDLVDRVYNVIHDSTFALPREVRGLSDERIVSRNAAGAIIIVEDLSYNSAK